MFESRRKVGNSSPERKPGLYQYWANGLYYSVLFYANVTYNVNNAFKNALAKYFKLYLKITVSNICGPVRDSFDFPEILFLKASQDYTNSEKNIIQYWLMLIFLMRTKMLCAKYLK